MLIVGLTDIGNGRKVNEDDYFYTTEQVGDLPNIFLVADGLGGHQAGEVASRLAIDSVVNYCLSTIEDNFPKLLSDAFDHANDMVCEYSKQNNQTLEMGTTLVGVTILEEKYIFANVGDSRAYIFRNGTLKKITKDHSFVQDLLDCGLITEEQAFHHESRNKITRAIGMEEKMEADIYTVTAMEDDIIMLCTDGLTNYVLREEMAEVMKMEKGLKEMAKRLIDTALDNGARDNITVVLVKNTEESEEDQC